MKRLILIAIVSFFFYAPQVFAVNDCGGISNDKATYHCYRYYTVNSSSKYYFDFAKVSFIIYDYSRRLANRYVDNGDKLYVVILDNGAVIPVEAAYGNDLIGAYNAYLDFLKNNPKFITVN